MDLRRCVGSLMHPINPADLAPADVACADVAPRHAPDPDDERHLDLRCWMALAARALATIGAELGLPQEVWLGDAVCAAPFVCGGGASHEAAATAECCPRRPAC